MRPLTEVEVVYIMAAIRKILDKEKLRNQYKALAFYCDWALHTSMDRTGALRMIKMFDDLMDSRPTPEGPLVIGNTLGDEVDKITSGTQLHEDLKGFLRAHDLPCLVCDDFAG